MHREDGDLRVIHPYPKNLIRGSSLTARQAGKVSRGELTKAVDGFGYEVIVNIYTNSIKHFERCDTK